MAAKGAKLKAQPALGETAVVIPSDGGFDSPRLHQFLKNELPDNAAAFLFVYK